MEIEKHQQQINWPDEEPRNFFDFNHLSNSQWILIACLLGQLIFVVEWITPRIVETASVITKEEFNATGDYSVNNSLYLYTTAGKVRISEKEFLLFDYQDTVVISKTRFNEIITKVELLKSGQKIELQSIVNIFFPFLFFPLLGFLSSLLGIYSNKILKDEQDIQFKFAVLSCLLFGITCIVYLLT